MAEKAKMNVAMAFDEKYVKYAYVTIFSLLENNPDAKIDLYILERSLSDASKGCISKLCEDHGSHAYFLYVDISRFEDKLPTQEWWPAEVYFRLLLTELLPSEIDRILYLDGDMVVNKSLSELYNTDITDYDMAACYDVCLDIATVEQFLTGRHKKLEVMFNDKTYINSGMLLMNIDRLRQNYSFADYMDALAELEFAVRAPDQDLINYVHDKLIKRLDPRKYNYPGYMVYYEIGNCQKAKETVPIIHFIGTKPWQGGNHIHYNTEQIWWDYACRTPFAEELMTTYISESVMDPTVENNMNNESNAKNALAAENAQLKVQLKEAMDSVKKVIAMFSEQDK